MLVLIVSVRFGGWVFFFPFEGVWFRYVCVEYGL